jgi:hypothetical protein
MSSNRLRDIDADYPKTDTGKGTANRRDDADTTMLSARIVAIRNTGGLTIADGWLAGRGFALTAAPF